MVWYAPAPNCFQKVHWPQTLARNQGRAWFLTTTTKFLELGDCFVLMIVVVRLVHILYALGVQYKTSDLLKYYCFMGMDSRNKKTFHNMADSQKKLFKTGKKTTKLIFCRNVLIQGRLLFVVVVVSNHLFWILHPILHSLGLS